MLSKRKSAFVVLALGGLATVSAVAEPISRMVPVREAPIPPAEWELRGNVERLEITVEYAGNESAPDEATLSKTTIWEKVPQDGMPVRETTFLVPQDYSLGGLANWFLATDAEGEETLWIALYSRETGECPMSGFDFRGRIRKMCSLRLLECLYPSLSRMNSFRYEFLYSGENGDYCDEAKLFFLRDGVPECEIGHLALRYEAGRPVEYLSTGDSYFFNDEKVVLKYDAQGFLTSKSTFNVTPSKLVSTVYFRNYEIDSHENWTHRDVFWDERFVGSETRKIEYAEEVD